MKQYCVIDTSAPYGPMEWSPDDETGEYALWHNYSGSLFDSYERARSAIRTSQRYEKRHGYNWNCDYRIVPMTPARSARKRP